jgi:uncharacterized protein YebE (UPF0316 family)
MVDILFSPQAWSEAAFIFILRVIEMSFDTLRVLLIIRNRKGFAWLVGLVQALIFVVAISSVLQDLDNPLTVLGWAAGFASGGVVGMLIEERLAIGYTHMRIVSSRRGAAIAEQLRTDGYAVTEISARGKDGAVTLLNCSVLRKHVDQVLAVAKELDPDVFITAEDLRPVRRGFWRA